MNPFLALLSHQARASRAPLLVALAANVVVLGAVHAHFPLPVAVSEAALSACAVLAAVWTLYFASDAFAESLSNGRLATLALLPTGPLAIWASRVAFVALSSIGISASIVVTEIAWQIAAGNEASLGHFVAGLDGLWEFMPQIALVAVLALLVSTLVESALAAALSTALAGAAVAWGWTRFEPWLEAGDMGLDGNDLALLVVASFVLVLGTGAFAFARAQRRLGDRWIRVRSAAAVLGATSLVAGLATAGERFRRDVTALERPRTELVAGTVSPDGRHLALQTASSSYEHNTLSVWLLDLEDGEYELLARPGRLLQDFHTGFALPWDTAGTFRYLRFSAWEEHSLEDVARVENGSDGPETTSLGAFVPQESRLVPDWAEIEFGRRQGDGSRELTVRWKGRELEHTFRGTILETMIGRGLALGSRPGRFVALRGTALELHDLESGAATHLLDGVEGSIQVAPDGSALVVRTGNVSHVLDTSDGRPLCEPIGEGRWVHFVATSGRHRVVRFAELRAERVLDLDTGRGCELETNRRPRHDLLLRLGDQGYVYVDRAGDLVLSDLDGRPVRVLLDR